MDELTVTIEVPKGSTVRYHVDPTSGRLRFDKELPTSMAYPTNCGYLDGTETEKGNAIGALVLLRSPLFPGTQVPIRLLGAIVVAEYGEETTTAVCVPTHATDWKKTQSVEQLSSHVRAQIEFFYLHERDLSPRRHFRTVKWGDLEHTQTIVDIARLRHQSLEGAK